MIALWLRLKTLWLLRTHALRVVRLFFDRRVPLALKALTGLGALVVVSPVDLLGDVPVLGALDDTLLLALLAWLFVRFCPPDVVADYATVAGAGRLKNVTPR